MEIGILIDCRFADRAVENAIREGGTGTRVRYRTQVKAPKNRERRRSTNEEGAYFPSACLSMASTKASETRIRRWTVARGKRTRTPINPVPFEISAFMMSFLLRLRNRKSSSKIVP